MIAAYREEEHRFGLELLGNPPPGVMYVFKDAAGEVVAVDFMCPCSCGSSCYTPVVTNGKPKTERHWNYSKGPTLTPSIRYTGGCKSHFNITNGRVIMHADSGR